MNTYKFLNGSTAIDEYGPDETLLRYLSEIRERDPALHKKVLIGPLEPSNIRAAVMCMERGGVILFFSRLTYGLATNGWSSVGVRRIYEIKGRSFTKPLSMLSNKKQFRRWVSVEKDVTGLIHHLLERYWPGELTLILPKSSNGEQEHVIPSFMTSNEPTVALMCMDKVTVELTEAASFPIAATSANFSGGAPVTDPIQGIEAFGSLVDLMLVGASSSIGINTTILDLCSQPPKVVRNGGVTHGQLREILPTVVPIASPKPA